MTARTVNYYEILGISREATTRQIRQAFRKLARQYHPDLAIDKTLAEERFKRINEAYEVLSDPRNRQKYDISAGRRISTFDPYLPKQTHNQSRPRQENFRPYTESREFRSFYEHFFGKCGDATNRSSTDVPISTEPQHLGKKNHSQPQAGKDISGEISIPLNQVLQASVHTISVLRNNPFTQKREVRSLHVRIPSGAYDGQILRLPRKGDYGFNGGDPGDLYLTIRVSADPRFRIVGNDLVCDLELSLWEALFGAKKIVAAIDETISVKVRTGTKVGHRLRLRGRGLPAADGTRGDLFAVVSMKGRVAKFAATILSHAVLPRLA